MKYVLPVLIAVAALLVSGTAAFYSVTGLGKLFAGASIPVMVMAASLEFSKLVTASLLYRYWTKLSNLLKTYLTIAVTVLILITSLGIYGFLTAAYQQTSGNVQTVDTEIALYESQKAIVQSQIDNLTTEQLQLTKSTSDLRSGLSNNVVKYTDAKGNLITTTSAANRAALERQLTNSTARQVDLDKQLSELNTRLLDLQTKISDLQIGLINTGELGPLKYISALSGVPVDSVVNYLVLTIVFVFDPLAIALVVAANFAFSNIEQEEETTLPEIEPVSEPEQPVVVDQQVQAPQPEEPMPVVQQPRVIPRSERGITRNAPAEDSLGKRYL